MVELSRLPTAGIARWARRAPRADRRLHNVSKTQVDPRGLARTAADSIEACNPIGIKPLEPETTRHQQVGGFAFQEFDSFLCWSGGRSSPNRLQNCGRLPTTRVDSGRMMRGSRSC